MNGLTKVLWRRRSTDSVVKCCNACNSTRRRSLDRNHHLKYKYANEDIVWTFSAYQPRHCHVNCQMNRHFFNEMRMQMKREIVTLVRSWSQRKSVTNVCRPPFKVKPNGALRERECYLAEGRQRKVRDKRGMSS